MAAKPALITSDNDMALIRRVLDAHFTRHTGLGYQGPSGAARVRTAAWTDADGHIVARENVHAFGVTYSIDGKNHGDVDSALAAIEWIH